MARKPTTRRSYQEATMELDLTPMMNLIGILIPVLLISTAFVEVAVLSVLAPSSGPSSNDQPPPDTPPLNLTLLITHKGYTLQGTGLDPIEIPLVEKKVVCSPFVDTVPPPRAKNRDAGVCRKEEAEKERPFWVYDTDALTKAIIGVKDAFPHEHQLIIDGDNDTEYESVTNAMDASREYKTAEGETRSLFGDVVLGGGTGS